MVEPGAGAPPGDGQDGESAVTAVAGVGMFLAFLLLAAQVLVYLHASSTVAVAAFDAASVAAGRASGPPGSAGARAAGEAVAGQLLGGLGAGGTEYRWRVLARPGGSSEVALTVAVPYPSVVGGGLGLGDIRREARVAVEQEPAP